MKKPRRSSTTGMITLDDLDDGRDRVDGGSMTVRRSSFRYDVGVREICEANGLSEDTFVREAQLLSSLDMFMSNLEDVRSLCYFRGLTALCFINIPNLNSVAGLDGYCPGLTRVTITECSLQTMEGLEGLTRLKELHLSSNQLQTLSGMKGLTCLRKLWANDNRLNGIDGLSSLETLEELWLCRNRITEIGDGLPLGPTLRDVNLAHNRLGCFKELLKLAPLEGLRSLTLQDPHFGDNPVCGLSNYKTYVAYHLTQLTSLDMVIVSEESEAFANTVFLKKSMYYNMRSRIVKRHAGHVVRKAIELCAEKAADLQTTLIHLQWQRKHVEQRRMSEAESQQRLALANSSPDQAGVKVDSRSKAVTAAAASGGGDIVQLRVGVDVVGGVSSATTTAAGVATEAKLASLGVGTMANADLLWSKKKGSSSSVEMLQLEAKGQALAQVVVIVENVLHKMEEQLSAFKEEVGRACQQAVSELMLEFDTGGNVRFEEGRPVDVWFSSCVDLVKSRVSTPLGEGGANGVKVSRVIRIHNRFLKNRFERSVKDVIASSTARNEISERTPPGDRMRFAAATEKPTTSCATSSAESESGTDAPEEARRGSGILTDGHGWQRRGASGLSTIKSGNNSNTSNTSSSNENNSAMRMTICDGIGMPSYPNDFSSSNSHILRRDTQEDDCGINRSELDTLGRRTGSAPPLGTSIVGDADELPVNMADGGGDGGGDKRGAQDFTRSSILGEKKASDTKRSSASRLQNLEYLFLAHAGARGLNDSCAQNENGGDYGDDASHRQRPDLLKLAEDGFRVADWSDVMGSKAEVGPEIDSQPFNPSAFKEKREKCGEGVRPLWPSGVTVLSSHLSEADISRVVGFDSSEERRGAAANGKAAERKGETDDGRCLSIVFPVCRVLVVKVYTGCSWRINSTGLSENIDEGGLVGPNVLKHAWERGFKSVCVSPMDSATDGGGGGDCACTSSSSRRQHWHVLDGALALPEYIIEFDVSPDLGQGGQSIKDGVRKRVNKWRHELAPSTRTSSLAASLSSSASSSLVNSAASGSNDCGGVSGGRSTGGADVMPFLIPLASLARRLEVDAVSFTRRYEGEISKALRMQPSAPSLGIPRGSLSGLVGHANGSRSGGASEEAEEVAPAFLIATGVRPAVSQLTRLSLHGQGVRMIEGLEACCNLEILILSFNEISRLDGLAELQRLRHLDLGYNVIEGVYRHLPNGSGISTTPGQAVTAAGIEAAATATTGRDHHPPDPPPDPSFSDGFVALPKLKPRHDGSSRRSTQVADEYSTTAVKHLVMLPALTRLDLNDNILHDLDDLKALWRLAPSLAVLDLRGNPIRSARTYRSAAIRGIPGLEVLDGRSVTREEASLHHACRSLTLDMLRRNGRRKAPRRTPYGGGYETQQLHLHHHQQPGCDTDSAKISYTGETDGEDVHETAVTNAEKNTRNIACSDSEDGIAEDNLGVDGNVLDDNAEGSELAESRTISLSPDAKKLSMATAITTRKGGTEQLLAATEAERPRSAPRMENSGQVVNTVEVQRYGSGYGGTSEEGREGHRVGDQHARSETGNNPDDPSSNKDRVVVPLTSSGLVLEDIELVNLHNLSLHKLEGMERLTRLRVADLSENELRDIIPLRWCGCLEELNLESNELTTAGLQGLVGLRRLCKLDLGYNQISDLYPIRDLVGLTQLSLESNLLHNLRGLNKLVNLMEFYCGNNVISAAVEVDRLRPLPRLIILDTSGNPMCSTKHFRLLVLFKASKLKVLDGVGVSVSETAAAKVKFVGKLTKELIWSKHDAEKVETVKYLDLSKSKWRSVEVLPSLPFRTLQELNLDRNFLVSFATLGGLRSLGVLRLSYNRIESMGEFEGDAGENKTTESKSCLFPRLEVLYLGFNRIINISALCLERMPRLLAVDLQGNSISNLVGLNRCRTLVEVNLDGNKLRQLGSPSTFYGLENLRKLRLEDNGLRTLSAGLGASTPALLSLSLAQNRLSDPAELERLGALPSLMEISLCGNPMVSKRSYSRLALLALFPSLAAVDSKDVTAEEKRLAEVFAGGSANTAINRNPIAARPAVPGIGFGGGSGGGGNSGAPGRGGTGSRRDYFTVGNIGGITRTSPAATQGGITGGRGDTPSGRGTGNGYAIQGGEDNVGPAKSLNAKAGPTSSGMPTTVSEDGGGKRRDSNGEATGAPSQQNRVNAHPNPKWAPLSTARRLSAAVSSGYMHSSPGGVKRPLKLTSMNFSSAPAAEEEQRGGMGSRVGNRSSVGVGIGMSVGGRSVGGSSGSCATAGSRVGVMMGSSVKPGTGLATLSGSGRHVSSATLVYNSDGSKIVSLQDGAGMGGSGAGGRIGGPIRRTSTQER